MPEREPEKQHTPGPLPEHSTIEDITEWVPDPPELRVVETPDNDLTRVLKEIGAEFEVLEIVVGDDHFQDRTTPDGLEYRTTPILHDMVPREAIEDAVSQFESHDWGDATWEQSRNNSQSISRNLGPVMASYQHGDVEFWVHQPHPEATPTVMLPIEY